MSEQRMKYEEAEEMVTILQKSQQELSKLQEDMGKIAEQLLNGILLGQGGEALSAALKLKLNKKLDALSDKLKEQEDYVKAEIHDMKEAEKKNAGTFG